MLQEADVAAVSRQFRLAVLKDAKVDVTALSEPIERWMDEPSGYIGAMSVQARVGAHRCHSEITILCDGRLRYFIAV
jgi:hypothetical protein